MRLRPVTDAGGGDGARPQLVDDVLRHPRLGGQRTAGEQHRGDSVPVCVHEAPALPEDDLAAPAHQTRAVQQQTDAGSAAGDAGVAGYGGPFSGQGAGQQEQVGGVVRRGVGGEPISGQATSTPSTISAGSRSLPVPASSRWDRVSVPLPVMTTVSKPPKWPISSQPVSAQQSPDNSSHRMPPEVLQRLGT